MPCLRTDDTTYTFAIPAPQPDGPVTFYCVILAKEDISQSDIERLQSALASATNFSGGAAEPAEPTPTWDDGQDATLKTPPAVSEEDGQGNSKV